MIFTQTPSLFFSIGLSLFLNILWPCVALDAGGLGRLTVLATESTDPVVRKDILRGMEAALRGRIGLAAPLGWDLLEASVTSGGDAETRSLVRSLGVVFGSRLALEALRSTVVDQGAAPGDRNVALTTLLRTRSSSLVELLQTLTADPVTRGLAIRGLAGFDDPRTAGVILSIFGRLESVEQRDALNTLASRVTYARPLLEAVRSQVVPKSLLTADLVRQLRSLKDLGVTGTLGEIWGVVRETSPDMVAEVERVKRIYNAGGSTPGNASRGRVVFNQICAQCHRLFESGGVVGPDITGANRSDINYLLQNILYPNAVIPNEYRASTVALKDDRVLTGLVRSQDAVSLVIQTANETVTVPRSEVSKVEMTEVSMMPEGLIAGLSDPQIRDLIYYLSRPGQVPLPVVEK